MHASLNYWQRREDLPHCAHVNAHMSATWPVWKEIHSRTVIRGTVHVKWLVVLVLNICLECSPPFDNWLLVDWHPLLLYIFSSYFSKSILLLLALLTLIGPNNHHALCKSTKVMDEDPTHNHLHFRLIKSINNNKRCKESHPNNNMITINKTFSITWANRKAINIRRTLYTRKVRIV